MGIKNLKNILHRRFGGILLLYLVFISISLVSRTVLLSMSFKDVSFKSAEYHLVVWSWFVHGYCCFLVFHDSIRAFPDVCF